MSCLHTYTHTHIYTHSYKMYIWTHIKHVWNDGAAATAREAQVDAKNLCPSPCPLQSGGRYPSWPAAKSPVHEKRRISAEQPQPTAAHRTITTARRPDHIRLSVVVPSRSTQFIVHASSQLGRALPKRGHFSAILAGFSWSWKTEFLEMQNSKNLGVAWPGDPIICLCLSKMFLMMVEVPTYYLYQPECTFVMICW